MCALNQTDDIPVDELFGTVISERVIDFAFLLVLTTAVLGGMRRLSIDGRAVLPGEQLIALGAIALGLVGVGVWKRKALALPFAQRLRSFLAGVWNGLNSIRHMSERALHGLFFIGSCTSSWPGSFSILR